MVDGGTVSAPNPPSMVGYDFVGWFYQGKEWDFSTPIVNDIVISARWYEYPEVATAAVTTDAADAGTVRSPKTSDPNVGYLFWGLLMAAGTLVTGSGAVLRRKKK